LPADSTYAFGADVENIQFDIWESGPCCASVLRLLQEIVLRHWEGEAKDRDNGFTVPVFSDWPQDDATDVDDPVIERLVSELKDIGNCRFALAWQSAGSEKGHVRIVNCSKVEAFRWFADWMTDEVYMVLDISEETLLERCG